MSHTPHHYLNTPPIGSVPFSRPGTPQHKEPPTIGFIGIGAMGHFMARNLANNRHSHPAGSPPLIVWNRTPEKAAALVSELGEKKARVAQQLSEIALEADVIVTNLANDEVVKNVFEELIAALEVNFVLPHMSQKHTY
jgi:3-hydroxyisobutyrate dehydrogenase-like beta-hydroxyacid dehydrogenase